MAVINTNVKALFSQSALKRTEGTMSQAMAQLSTGKRINTAADDAAGLAIATRMTHQIRSLNQAVRNAGDAINLIQTAEGATNEITDMMQRMRELAIQAVNDTNDNAQRSYLDLEFQQLKAEIVHIAESTEWNGFPVLNGTAGERVGEMPVYKTTSVSHVANVYTPSYTMSEEGAPEQQMLTFDVANLAAAGGTITVDGVPVIIPAGASAEDAGNEVKLALETAWAADPAKKDRTISAANADGEITVTFGIKEQNAAPIGVGVGASGIVAEVETVRQAITTAKQNFPTGGAFRTTGSLDIAYDPTGATSLVASFTGSDGLKVTMTGAVSESDGTITFKASEGRNNQVITQDLVYTLQNYLGNAEALTDRKINMSVAVGAGVPALETGDLIINGIDIGATSAADDLLSPPANAAGSAIAIAAAINRMAGDVGQNVGETQSIVFTGTPVAGQTITVGGVNIQLTANEKTSAQAAAKIVADLRNSSIFGASTGRTITYAPGGTTIKINFPVNEGNVPKTEVIPGSSGLQFVVNTDQEYTTVRQGTGVWAKVNENVFTGQAMSPGAKMDGVVYINGYASPAISTVLNNPRATRLQVVDAINTMSAKTGVKAVDTGFDSKGITLLAADGRNIEVRFETTGDANAFGQRIGLRQGVQTSTYSLESKIPAPVVITSAATGKIERSGLIEGNFTKNQSVFNTAPRSAVSAPVAQTEAVSIVGADADDNYSVVINGRKFTSGANTATSEDKRNDLISQINAVKSELGVEAIAGRTVGEMQLVATKAGTPFTLSVSGEADNVGAINTETLAKNKIAQSKPLNLNDLVINGIKIRATTSKDDQTSASPAASSDQSASALAIAAAINSHSAETGVRAQANPVVIKGLPASTSLPAVDTANNKDFYDLFVNGTKVSVQFVQNEDPRVRANKVVAALNTVSHLTGVSATNNGGGVTLESDGRNVSVWFDSSRPDVSAASFGLDQGGAVAQVSKIKLSGTPSTVGQLYGVRINGEYIKAVGGADAEATADALAAAIQSAIDSGDLTNIVVSVNNGEIEIASTVPGSPFTLDGATVRDSGGNGTFPDDYDVAEDDLTMALSSVADNSGGNNIVTAIFGGSATSTSAKTMYGTVRLISDPALLPKLPSPIGAPPSDQLEKLKATGRPFTIAVGDNGFVDAGNFSSLGFQEGTFGGRSSEDMDPPRVGRLAFQVGSSANQYITIDLADFGKKGSITGELTGDIDKNVEDRSTRINSREGASSVLRILDDAMDKVNATRATMGAVMNRLEHVITNLSNVSTNLSESRSHIEDADYALASTELAKTQIMQQAATAVLAQANTSQQTVLKLLGG